MMYSQEALEMINEYAALLMLPNEIAEILEVNRKEFISELNDPDSEVRKSYYKGFLLTEVLIRKKAFGKSVEGENTFIDLDEAKYNSETLNNFKAKLIIQLNA